MLNHLASKLSSRGLNLSLFDSNEHALTYLYSLQKIAIKKWKEKNESLYTGILFKIVNSNQALKIFSSVHVLCTQIFSCNFSVNRLLESSKQQPETGFPFFLCYLLQALEVRLLQKASGLTCPISS